GGLRGGRRALAGETWIVVTAASFAPAAARLLYVLEPSNRPPNHRLPHIKADALEARQHLPGAVNVIDAPAADPAAETLLRAFEEGQGAVHMRHADALAVVPERLQDA